MSDTPVFYFLCHPRGDRKAITVIDLAYCVAYERDDWVNVNRDTFIDRDEAIQEARRIAQKHGLHYEAFDSRYENFQEELR